MKNNDTIKTIVHYIKNYKFNSVFIKNFRTVFIAFLLPVFLITAYIYISVQKSADSEIRQNAISQLNKISDTAETVLTSAENIAIKTSTQTDTQNFFYTNNIKNISSSFVSETSTYEKNLTHIETYLDSIFIYSSKNKYIISNNGVFPENKFNDMSWKKNFEALKEPHTVIIPRRYLDMYPYYITILFPVINENKDKIGCSVININAEEFCNFVAGSHISETQKLFIINKENKILFSNDYDLHGKNATSLDFFSKTKKNKSNIDVCTYNGEKYLLCVISSEKFGFKYVSMIPEDIYNKTAPSIGLTMIGTLTLILLASIFLTLIITVKTYEPLKNIISVIDKPENYSQPKIGNKNEIQYIITNIMSSITKNNKMETLLEQRLILLNRAQTKALQAQINPHFLYNTLENLNMLAIDLLGCNNKISDIVSSMSKLFRISADTKNYIISMKDEIEYSTEYIKILKIRCINDFTVIWDVDKELLDSLTVKLCLQPILENAVNHGIKFSSEPGIICITGKITENDMLITVYDNGKGVELQKRIQMNREFKEQYIDEFNHIGMKNTNQRIKLIFGKKYGVSFAEDCEKGTKVEILLPNIKSLD